jgi:GAF domain-containing protein
VIARDISSGNGFIVREAEESVEEAVAGPSQPPSGVAASAMVSSSSGLRARLARVRDAETRGKACQAALVVARRLVTAESGAVILADGPHLRCFAAAGPQAQRLLGAKLPADEGIAAFCMRQQRSVVLEDAAVDPRHIGDIDRLTGYVTHALACVPVIHLDRVFGVIELINLPDNTAFSRQCVHELNAIAQALGERLEKHRIDRLTG